jgi:hypothetical protein
MSRGSQPELVPYSSWFGPIPAWRLAILADVGAAAYVLLPQVVDHARPSPWWLLGAVAVGALLGVPMGRQDARGTMGPRSGRNGRLVWPGLAAFFILAIGFPFALTLAESAYLYAPLFVVVLGVSGVTGGWSRDRLLSVEAPRT